MLMMMAATFLYGIGYTMFGFISSYPLFMLAMAIITVGEMLHIPVAQALVARFAPASMRGRYMAVYSVGWTIPFALGPLGAGLVMDNFNPNLVWFIGGGLSLITLAGFYWLQVKGRDRFKATLPEEDLPPVVEGSMH